MKVTKILSLMGTVVFMSACGSGNSANQAALSQGYNQYGVNTYNNGASGGCGSNSGYTLSQVPLYSNNQFVGYKMTSAVAGGAFVTGYQTTFQETVSVCAGDQLMINSVGATYGVAQAYCGSGVVTGSVSSSLGGTISNLTATLNGQAVGAAVNVPQNGTLVISGSYPAITRNCGFPYSGTATISYYVDLGRSITVQRCVNAGGAAIQCPY